MALLQITCYELQQTSEGVLYRILVVYVAPIVPASVPEMPVALLSLMTGWYMYSNTVTAEDMFS
jgi:hypothetical protein